MKILLISNMYPNKSNPQYGVFVKNTVDILERNDITCSNIVLYKTNNKVKKAINYLFYYLKIVFLGCFKKYDLIYVHYASHNSIPLILLKALKPSVKICTNVHGSDVIPEKSIQKKLQKYVGKLLRLSDRVIVPSNYYKNKVIERYALNEKMISIFPSGGINTSKFKVVDKEALAKQKYGIKDDKTYLGFVGRIEYKKGWDTFLKAVRLLRDEFKLDNFSCVIVGSGAQYHQYKKMVDDLNLQDYIIHYDFLNQDELVSIYNTLDVFCFPTKREGESLGLVGLEAMACGVPVIASNYAGPTDYVIDNVNGYLFEMDNENELAEKIYKFLMLSKEEKSDFRRNALSKANEYDSNVISSRIVDILKGI